MSFRIICCLLLLVTWRHAYTCCYKVLWTRFGFHLFWRYGEVGFVDAMFDTEKWQVKMRDERTFFWKLHHLLRVINNLMRKRVDWSVEDFSRVNYLFKVNQTHSSLNMRFKVFETNFGFLYGLKRSSIGSLNCIVRALKDF